MRSPGPVVAVVMGSTSDWSTMQRAVDVLVRFGVTHEATVVSAHRTPDRMVQYAKTARERGLKCIIAGAGGAAHLPGMVASMTSLPVIGVPVKSRNSIDGWDSLLSIVQMPGGVPVATVAVNGAQNAGILAAQIIGVYDGPLATKLDAYKKALGEKVGEGINALKQQFPNNFDK